MGTRMMLAWDGNKDDVGMGWEQGWWWHRNEAATTTSLVPCQHQPCSHTKMWALILLMLKRNAIAIRV